MATYMDIGEVDSEHRATCKGSALLNVGTLGAHSMHNEAIPALIVQTHTRPRASAWQAVLVRGGTSRAAAQVKLLCHNFHP